MRTDLNDTVMITVFINNQGKVLTIEKSAENLEL